MDTKLSKNHDRTAERIEAAVRYIKDHPRSKTPAIAMHLCMCRTRCSEILRKAIKQGRVAYVRIGGSVVWVLADDAERLKADARRLSMELLLKRQAEQSARERAARAEARKAAGVAIEDEPIRRSFVRAGDIPPPHTTAPRSVFDWRPAA